MIKDGLSAEMCFSSSSDFGPRRSCTLALDSNGLLSLSADLLRAGWICTADEGCLSFQNFENCQH